MRNQPSSDPRDLLVQAAMRDAVALGSVMAGEFVASYEGANRSAYLAALGEWLADLGVVVSEAGDGPVASFADRRIRIRFERSRG